MSNTTTTFTFVRNGFGYDVMDGTARMGYVERAVHESGWYAQDNNGEGTGPWVTRAAAAEFLTGTGSWAG